MDVTSISSTMHLRVSPAWRASLQVDLSSAAHRPTNRPCKDHLCSSDKSVIVIFSTTLPRLLAGKRRHPKLQRPHPSRYLLQPENADTSGKQILWRWTGDSFY